MKLHASAQCNEVVCYAHHSGLYHGGLSHSDPWSTGAYLDIFQLCAKLVGVRGDFPSLPVDGCLVDIAQENVEN